MQKMVSYGVKQDEKDVIAVWKMKRYFEAKLKDKKQDWKTDKLAYFLKKSLSIYTFIEDGFVSFILFQCCVSFWLYSENATLWLIFCKFSFIWFKKSLLYSLINFNAWLADSLFHYAIKSYKPSPFPEYIYLFAKNQVNSSNFSLCMVMLKLTFLEF